MSGGQTSFVSSSNGVVHQSNSVQRPDGTVSTQNFVNGVPVGGTKSVAGQNLDSRFNLDEPHHSGIAVSGGQTFVSSQNGISTQTSSVQNPDGSVSTQTLVNGKPVTGSHGLDSRFGDNQGQSVGQTSVVSSHNGVSVSSASIQQPDGSVVTHNSVNGNS